MNAKMNAELKSAKSVQEMLDIIGKYYDLDNCKPGAITKALFLQGMEKGIKMLNPKPRG